MPDFDHDPIGAAFADFRSQGAHMMKPPGMAPVRATVRRRHHLRMAAGAAAAAIAIIVPAAGYAYVSGGHRAPAPGGVSPSPGTSQSTPPSAGPPSAVPDSTAPSSATGSPTATQVPDCRAAQLSGAVTAEGSNASQPFVVIALTNTSGAPCQLIGYPQIKATGYPQATPTAVAAMPITVTNGATWERTDPGPHHIELAPQASASFALGTQAAYDGGAHLYTISRLRISLPNDQTSTTVAVDIAAGAPTGRPIPVTVTALVAGRSGPP